MTIRTMLIGSVAAFATPNDQGSNKGGKGRLAALAAKKAAIKEEPKEEVDANLDLAIEAFTQFKDKMGREPRLDVATLKDELDADTETSYSVVQLVNEIIPQLEESEEGESAVPSEPYSAPKDIRDLADIANKDKELIEHISLRVETDTLKKKLPAMLALDFQRAYTKDQLAEFAVPGLKRSDMKAGDNHRKPDIEKVGEPGWYMGFYYTLNIAADTIKALDELSDKTGHAAKADKAMYMQRRNSGVAATREAIETLRGFEALASETNLEAWIRTTKQDGKVVLERTTVPIAIKEKDDKEGKTTQFLSMGQFRMICRPEHLAKISKAEDQMKALRPDRKPRTDATKTPVNVQTVDQGIDAITELAEAVKETKFSDNLMEKFNATDEMGDDLFFDGYELNRYLDRFYSKPSNVQRLKALKDKREAEEAAKTKAADKKAA